jgi:gluconolactonase
MRLKSGSWLLTTAHVQFLEILRTLGKEGFPDMMFTSGRIFTSDLSVPEGPVLLPDGSWLVVEMGPDRGCVTHIGPDGGKKRVITRTGRPNGLAVDKDGIIWVAESQTPSLLRLTMEGEVDVFLTECDGEPFLFPNDLAFGPHGALYMTDSGILIDDFAPGGHVRPDYMTAPMDGRVYQINVQTREIRKLDKGIRFTNGIAFGPDRNLYVNEMLTATVYRYRWQNGEIVGGPEDFGNVADPESMADMKFLRDRIRPGRCHPTGAGWGSGEADHDRGAVAD